MFSPCRSSRWWRPRGPQWSSSSPGSRWCTPSVSRRPRWRGRRMADPGPGPPPCHTRPPPPPDTRTPGSRPTCWRRHCPPDQPLWHTRRRHSQNLVWRSKGWIPYLVINLDFLLPRAFIVGLVLVGERKNTFRATEGLTGRRSFERKLARSNTNWDNHYERLEIWHLDSDWFEEGMNIKLYELMIAFISSSGNPDIYVMYWIEHFAWVNLPRSLDLMKSQNDWEIWKWFWEMSPN